MIIIAAHFIHASYFGMLAASGAAAITDADNDKFRCDLREAVYDQTRTPRADFVTAWIDPTISFVLGHELSMGESAHGKQ